MAVADNGVSRMVSLLVSHLVVAFCQQKKTHKSSENKPTDGSFCGLVLLRLTASVVTKTLPHAVLVFYGL